MPFSRYLYSKVMESKDKFVCLFLNQEEIKFLNKLCISFSFDKDSGLYVVDTERLKNLFFN